MGTILNGKSEAKKITLKLTSEFLKLKTRPTLAVILIGNDPASKLYVGIKEKKAKELSVNFKKFELSEKVAEKKVLDLILKLNKDKKVNGIMVQLPLPKKFNTQKIIDVIDIKKDVDCLRKKQETRNKKQISIKLISPTIQSILHLIKMSKQNLVDKKAIIFCNSLEFGKSLADLLKKKFKTKIVNSNVQNCDLVITAKGKKYWLKAEKIKKDSVVIDVGISKDKNNKTRGDVHPDCWQKTKYISPVPGGVGPLTVVFLFKNLLKIKRDRN